MVESNPIRVGVVGAGANTKLRHIPGLQAIDGVEVTVVCNRSEASSRTVAEEFGIAGIAGDWHEVVADENIDAVCIGTWPYLHADITCAALNAGKHVLTEARMARDVAEAERMLAASKQHPDLVAQIVPAPMSLDLDSTVAGIITEGRLGALREVCITNTSGLLADDKAPFSWRQDSELSGLNIMMMGIYYEMGRRWVQVDPERVLAQGRVFTDSRTDSNGNVANIEIPDSITVLGDYSNGARFVGHFSGVESTAFRNEIRLNGSQGCLRADLAESRLFFAQVGGKEEEVTVPESERRGWQVEADFVDSIRNGTPVRLTNFEDGLAYMRFTEAAYRSQQQGSVWTNL